MNGIYMDEALRKKPPQHLSTEYSTFFGIAIGETSVAARFSNCIGTFEYIHLGRNLGEDYERYQLKVDVAELRLGRWGETVGVNSDIRFASLIVHDNNGMNLLFQRLHKRSKDIARRRQKGISIITSWVDELEKLFPIELTQQKFIENEIKEVNDELSLKTLKDAARDIDPALERAAGQKVDSIEGKNSARDITMEDKARFHVGNVFSEGVLQHEILVKDQASNSIETVSAKNETRIQVGNVYGGKGIWDD
ncbi:prion-inhibition and propagation-domain-containing protein [Trichoderma sp. SZMC 28011]